MRKKYSSNPFIIEQLEPRLLFSADAGSLPIDALLPHDDGMADYSVVEAALVPGTGSTDLQADEEHERHEVIFVDAGVSDYQKLVDDLMAQNGSGRYFEVILLDSSRDGIEQISETLSKYQDIDALHIISHGKDGAVQLGNTFLNLDTVGEYAESIAGWQDALSNEADLLFYGCDLAAGHDGQILLDNINTLTGADVAASDDITGNVKLGGDWKLEYTSGVIDTTVAFSENTQQNWTSTLANDAPVLSGANDLTAIDEDPVSNDGTLVSDLISGKVTDADTGALSGIAVILVDDTNGTWQFTTNSGTLWTDFGTVDASAARLLADNASTYVRFVPNEDWNGTVTNGITFHAWDQTTGSNGSTVNLSNQTVLDQFSTVAYSNNDGNTNWTSNWIESNDNGAAATGNVRIESDKLHIDNLDGGSYESITRSFDLSNATNATLSFDYDGWCEGTVDGDRFTIEVSDDGGFNWTFLEEIIPPNSTNFTGNRSYNLESSISLTADMVVRFSISMGFGGTTQHVNFDNVQITSNIAGTGGVTAISTATASSSITVNPVNDAPIAVADSFTVNEGSTNTLDLAANDTDADDGLDLTSITIISGPTNGTIDSINADGTVDYTHNGSETLSDSFTYTIDDLATATSNTVTVSLTITPQNDAPIAVADSFTVNEGSTNTLDLAANDTDADDGLDLTSITIISGPTNGTIDSINADGTVDYTHNGSETLSDSFTYTIDDLATATSNTVTVSLTITPQNDAPVAVADSFTVNEGSTNTLDLAANDTDADDGLDLTSITIISGPTNGTIDSINADGTVDYTHNGSETLSDSFTYTIDDLATATSNTVTVSLTITPQNDAPIAVADSFTVNEGSTNTLDLAANDSDTDNGLDLTSITIVSGPTNGTIDSINADGTVDYTHNGSETLSDSFTYTIDDLATATSNTVTVSLTITPQNDAPIAVADSFTVNEGSTNTLDLAANDTDADDGLDLTSITIISGPTNGTIDSINADGTVDYTHNGSETLSDSFTYTIDDLATATSNTVTVSLTITPQNDAPVAVADSFTVNEGSTNTLDLAANDTDADDGLDLTSITIISGPTNGTIDSINADGTVDYTHNGSETLSDSFTYTIDDLATATSNTVTVSLTITPQNDAPIAVADSFTVNEGSTNTLDLAANDSDTDNGLDLTSITIVSGPTNGTIDSINADGTVDYTHNGSETLSDSFTYTIDDLATATSNTVTVSLTITPQNDAPIAVADSFTVNEGSTNTLDLAANDTDADDGLDLTSITIISGPTNGTIDSINADGTVDYTHNGSETLSDSFTYTIDDLATATSNTVTVSLTITPQNDAPVAVADSFTVNEGSTNTLDLAANDTDADDGLDLTSITIISGPTNGTIDSINADGTVDYTHNGSETLSDSFTYTIDDLATATSNTVTVSLTITPQNDAPIAVADSFTVNEGSTNTLDLAANDSDTDNGLDLTSITIVSGPTNGTIDSINADGTVDYTHNGSETLSDSFTYTIDDLATATSNTVTVSLTITPQNDAPVAVADSFTVNEGSTNTLDLAANDSDTDNGLDLTSITIVSGPTNGTIDSINADGTVDYTHNGSETLSDSFTYTIDDLATATSNTVTVSLTITPQNDAPIAVADSFTVNEGSTNTLDLAANDTDADDGLDLTSITIISGPTNGTIDSINADGTVDYTHNGSETLSDSFTYTIDDLATATSNTVTVSLTITPQNDAPVAVADSFTVNEGSTNTLDLAANDTDADDGLDLTSITIVSGPTNGTIDSINADGTVDYTHNGSETLSDSFTYTIDDLATATSNTVTVSLTITPQNDAPIAVADSFTVNEGSTNTLDLAANDTDADDGLDLTSITIISGPTNGTIDSINADGTVDYTHNGSETLSDSFTYTIDDLATATSNTVTVSLTITPQNDAPVAVADSFTVNEGSTNTLDLAANDTDADDGLDLTSITIISGPTNGTIDSINADGTVDYTHNGSETLSDSFTYTIDDLATATSNTVTVSLTITPQNDAPMAVADSFTVNEGSTNTLDLAANDTDADDGLDLTSITIISGPTNGTIDSINADGTVDYTHNGSETLSDSFTYTIDDLATATSNTVTVSLTITPQNDAPVAVADSFTVNEGSTNTLDLAANDTDADDGLDLTSITIISGPTNGTIDSINADGTVDYTHNGSETLSDSFTYTIDDLATATSNTVTVSLTITPQNDAPVAVADSFTVNEGSTNTLDLAANDTDADDGLDLTSITIISGPTNGTIDSINADGTVDYTHNGSETLSDSFTYTIDDLATATSNTVTVSLTITPQNDAPIAVADSFTVNEGSTNTLDLAANDTDADDGLDLTSITIVSGPTNGTIDSINADGTVDYTHNGSETLSDSFTYTIDDLATATSNTVTVSLTITPQNDAPIAVADSFTVNEGSTNTLDLAANDTDADDGLDLTSITIISGPTNGTIDSINADGSVDYTHNGSETLSDSFTYTIDDLATATSNTVTVSLTITPQNDAPMTTNLSAGETYTEDTPLNLTDIVVSDVDSANVTVTLTLSDIAAGSLSTGTSGAVTSTFVGGVWTANGAIADVNTLLAGVTFNPSLYYNSNFTIATSVDDGVAPTITGTKNMTSTPQNDAPTVSATATDTGSEDTSQVYTHAQMLALIGAADVDDVDANLGISITNVVNGTVILSGGTGWVGTTFTFTPDPNFVGSMTFDYQVFDDDLAASAVGTATVAVAERNDTPPPAGTTDDPPPIDTEDPVAEEETTEEPLTEDPVNDTQTDLLEEILQEENTMTPGNRLSISLKDTSVALHKDSVKSDMHKADNRSDNFSLDRLEIRNSDYNETYTLTGLISDAIGELYDIADDINTSIEELGDSIESIEQHKNIIAKTAVAGALTLSAGMATWVLRGGSLIASALTTMPIWKGFDPLYVLPHSRKERRKKIEEISKAEEEELKKNRKIAEMLDERKKQNVKKDKEADKS